MAESTKGGSRARRQERDQGTSKTYPSHIQGTASSAQQSSAMSGIFAPISCKQPSHPGHCCVAGPQADASHRALTSHVRQGQLEDWLSSAAACCTLQPCPVPRSARLRATTRSCSWAASRVEWAKGSKDLIYPSDGKPGACSGAACRRNGYPQPRNNAGAPLPLFPQSDAALALGSISPTTALFAASVHLCSAF